MERDKLKDIDSLVQMYFDGELSEEDRLKVEKILSENTDASNLLKSYQKMSEMLREYYGVEEAGSLVEKEFEKIRRRLRDSESVSIFEKISVFVEEFIRYRKRFWVPVATVLLVILWVAVLMLGFSNKLGVNPPNAPQEWSRVTSISLGASSSMVLEVEDEEGGKTTLFWVIGENEEKEKAGIEGGEANEKKQLDNSGEK